MKLNIIEKWVVLNPLRRFIQRRWEVPFLLKKGGGISKNSIVLEVGSSVGFGAKCLQEITGAHVLALEYDASLLARRNKSLPNVHFLQGSAENLPFGEETLDAVFSFGVFHHLPNWQQGVEEAYKSLKVGGKLYLEEFYAPLITHFTTRYIIKHPQFNRFTHAELLQQAQKQGFTCVYEKSVFGLMGWVVLQK